MKVRISYCNFVPLPLSRTKKRVCMPICWLIPTSVSKSHRPGLDGYISRVAKLPAKLIYTLNTTNSYFVCITTVPSNNAIRKEQDSPGKKTKHIMFLTRQQRKDSLSVAGSLFVEERLPMEVDTLVVSGRTHVYQVPAHKLVGVHPKAL